MIKVSKRSPFKKLLAAAAALLTAVPTLAAMPAIPAAAVSEGGRVELDANGVLHLYGAFSKADVQYYAGEFHSTEDEDYDEYDDYFYWWEYPNGEVLRVIAEEGAVFPADSSDLFNEFAAAESMDFSKADTSNVTDMSYMFFGCESLTTLDLSGFDTANVTNMGGMFDNCENLTSLDLSGFDTANVTNMHDMFWYCESLSALNMTDFDTANVTNMSSMFGGCQSLPELDLSSFDTANVTNMSFMFDECSGLTSLDLSSFNTAKVTDMHLMFVGCRNLTSLDLSNFNTANVADMDAVFRECNNLAELDLSSFDTANVTSMYGMFDNCKSLTAVDLSSFDTAKVKNMGEMFYGCENLKTIYASALWKTAAVTWSDEMFEECGQLCGGAGTKFRSAHTDMEYARIDQGTSVPGYLTYKEVTEVVFDGLLIAGETVTSKNASDILGDGVFRYIPGKKELQISGDAYFRYDSAKPRVYALVQSSIDGLTIKATKDAVLTTDYYIFLLFADTEITGPGKLTMITEGTDDMIRFFNEATLTIRNADLNIQGEYAIYGDDAEHVIIDHSRIVSTGMFGGIEDLGLIGCEIVSPEGGYFSYGWLRGADGVSCEGFTIDLIRMSIIAQPTDYEGKIGSTAEFKIQAEGNGLTYQWQYDNGSGWKDSGMTGAKTSTLSVEVTAARDGQKYRCIVTGSNGATATSAAAVLKVKPAISTQPANVTAAVGATAKFTVAASGTGLKYQWQYNNGSGWKNSTQTGYNTATLSVPVIASRDGQKYRCIVTGSNGTTATSNAVTLKVKTVITKQPANASGAVGSNVKFSVTASGAGTLSYQWQYYDKTSSTWKDSGMTGAKTATLTVPVTEARNGQKYRCIVKSSNGTSATSSSATLTVKAAAPTITKQPANVSGTVGSKVSFSVTASGTGTLSYQWQYYSKSAGEWKNSGLSSAKTSTLNVTVSETSDGQQYRCIVKSSNGTSVTSSVAKLTVPAAPTITKQPANASGAVGSKVSFSVTASGTGTLSYQWQYYSKSAGEWKNSGLSSAKTSTLSVTVSATNDGMQYRCIVKSSNGTSVTSSVAKLTVKAAITKQPANATGAVDSTVKFQVTATGAGLTYQWQYDNGSGWKDSGMTGANTDTLSVPVTAARNGQKYRCVIKDANGKTLTSSTAILTVKK